MRFLVQKIDHRLKFDFQRELAVCQDYARWRNHPFSIRYCSEIPNLKYPDKYIPVGSVEFVLEYVQRYFPDKTDRFRPKNVPQTLFQYAGRMVCNTENLEMRPAWITDSTPIFSKSNLRIKDPENGTTIGANFQDLQNHQISSIVESIASEWRVFVYHNEIQQVCYYDGDPLRFPDPKTIESIVSDYSEQAPPAYTVDVFVDGSTGNTGLMEVHDFYSCGLYGFSDYRVLPYMLSQTWYHLIRN